LGAVTPKSKFPKNVSKATIFCGANNGGVERGEPTILTAIEQVKGCWRPEVQSAMAHQLTNRYLHENDCQTGLCFGRLVPM
jgi:hypothetical protein